jgi:hypothetical protein
MLPFYSTGVAFLRTAARAAFQMSSSFGEEICK